MVKASAFNFFLQENPMAANKLISFLFFFFLAGSVCICAEQNSADRQNPRPGGFIGGTGEGKKTDAGPKSRTARSRRFEYKVVTVMTPGRSEQDSLNALGAEGWELISVRETPQSVIVYYFKLAK
jgi:hypothetical protein